MHDLFTLFKTNYYNVVLDQFKKVILQIYVKFLHEFKLIFTF